MKQDQMVSLLFPLAAMIFFKIFNLQGFFVYFALDETKRLDENIPVPGFCCFLKLVQAKKI